MQIDKFTKKVLCAYSNFENGRTQEIVHGVIKHTHELITELNLSKVELEATWEFLAKMAKFTSAERNEFILMADVLGISQLVELVNDKRNNNIVGAGLLGPFYRANPPFRARGAATMSPNTPGVRVHISGRVVDLNGNPISNAVVDTWQCAPNGLYDCQDPSQPDMNLRGRFITDELGSYELIGLLPVEYPVPTDGPTGDLLRLAQRSAYRPAHIHFIVSAPQFTTLVTQLFPANESDLDDRDNDVVFTKMENMVGEFVEDSGLYYLTYNFQLIAGESIYPHAPIQ